MPKKKAIPKPEERLVKDQRTKSEYHYIDTHNDIDIKSREVYKNSKRTIHYPFRPRTGATKYKKILAIEYVDMPDSLPRGFLKSFKSGYGFTREINGLLYALEDKIDILRVIVSSKKTTKLVGKTLTINAEQLNNAYPPLKALYQNQKSEADILIADLLAKILPKKFKKKSGAYVPGSLDRFIKQQLSDYNLLSQADKSAILDIVKTLAEGQKLLDQKKVLDTKEVIEKYFIEEIITEYEKILKQKTDSKHLEDKWQTFFKKYSWVFSQLFSFPVLLLEEKAYVGGKGLDNKDGKIADFLYKNYLSDNIAIIEIKTHATALLHGKGAYRGKDVYPISKDLTGAINQVLDQRDNLQKEFYELSKKYKKTFETFNSKCNVVLGRLGLLKANQKKSFELFRSNSRDVEIVTYDELLEKLKGLRTLLFGDKKEK